MSKKPDLTIIAFLALAFLSACSNAKEQLGLSRSAPDEFAVVKRAPLEMPPDYSLRPPRPGAPRPQEQAVNTQAREAVFGADREERRAAPASGESALLQQAGALNTNSEIRTVIDQETALTAPENKPVAERLFGIKVGSHKESGVLNPAEEAARLKAQQQKTAPVEEVPTTEE